jgi:hypothetical protein
MFRDAKTNAGKDKPGYRKVQFCLEQAQKDSIDYVWIDSCCINKDSSAELSEAINSMFKWYHGAVKCYVWLSDVSTRSEDDSGHTYHRQPSWMPSFTQSKWFTRSWTLQELLAPKHMEFFSCDGESLGQKDHLRLEIHRITGVPVEVLQDSGLLISDFNIKERLSWARDRQAKRDEDHEYALLGLFDIHMPLLYGEGREKARARLEREIWSMVDHNGSEPVGSPFQEAYMQSGSIPSRYESPRDCWNGPDRSLSRERFDTCKSTMPRPTRPRTRLQHQQSDKRTHEMRDDSHSNHPHINPAHGTIHEFRTYGGTQNNNMGSGNQYNGDINGSIHFG